MQGEVLATGWCFVTSAVWGRKQLLSCGDLALHIKPSAASQTDQCLQEAIIHSQLVIISASRPRRESVRATMEAHSFSVLPSPWLSHGSSLSSTLADLGLGERLSTISSPKAHYSEQIMPESSTTPWALPKLTGSTWRRSSFLPPARTISWWRSKMMVACFWNKGVFVL